MKKTRKPTGETLPGGLTLADLETELGSDPDWPTIKADPELLRGYAETLATTRQVRAGIIPNGWTGVFRCARCGPVCLQPGGPKDLLACPWCFNREHGLPVPRPAASRPTKDARTADQLTPAERSRWCMAHELTQPGHRCQHRSNLDACVLWRAIRERWPLARLAEAQHVPA